MMRGSKKAMPVKVIGDALGVIADALYGQHAPGGAVRAEADTGTVISNLFGARTGAQLERGEAIGVYKRAEAQLKEESTDLKRAYAMRSEEHTSELQSLRHLVC